VPAKQASSPGSAAEPGKKPQPERAEPPAADHVRQAPVSAPGVLAGSQQPSKAPPAPELALSDIYAPNQAFAQDGLTQGAINSEVPEAGGADRLDTPAATSPPGASLPSDSLGDDWSRIVNQLVAAEAIAALTRELALQSELCSRSDGVWVLRVERESLSQPAAREKLQLALQTALDDTAIKLSVELGSVADSPARRNSAALAERQSAAEALIQNDPFVQDMIRNWGAKIVPGSIKSVVP
jgi:DNA polymerase-3 subunit gamma/tau